MPRSGKASDCDTVRSSAEHQYAVTESSRMGHGHRVCGAEEAYSWTRANQRIAATVSSLSRG